MNNCRCFLRRFSTMPLPTLNIRDTERGLPRQPVPLRYACLVTELSFVDFLFLLAFPLENGYPHLRGYKYKSGAEPLLVEHSDYLRILETHPKDASSAQLLALLPPNHFVWSDELADAFSCHIRERYGGKDSQPSRRGLRWTPDLHGADSLLQECADLKELRFAADGGRCESIPRLPRVFISYQAPKRPYRYTDFLKAFEESRRRSPLKPDRSIENTNESRQVIASRPLDTDKPCEPLADWGVDPNHLFTPVFFNVKKAEGRQEHPLANNEKLPHKNAAHGDSISSKRPVIEKSRRELRTEETAARYQKMCQAAAELKKKHPDWRYSDTARAMSKLPVAKKPDGTFLHFDTIRTILRKNCK